MANITISICCPGCGGSLSVSDGEEMISCPYCSALLSIGGESGIRKIALKNLKDKDHAVKVVRGLWQAWYADRDLSRKASITETFLAFVPFWKVPVTAAGWVCGLNNTDNGKIPKEKMVLQKNVWYEIACDAGDIGDICLEDLTGEAIFFDPHALPAFEITTSESDTMQRAAAQAWQMAAKSADLTEVTYQKIDIFPGKALAVFYPLWIVRYTFHGRIYQATVDGVTGHLLSGRTPGSNLLRSVALAAGMAVGGFSAALFCLFVLVLLYHLGISEFDPGPLKNNVYLMALGLASLPVCIIITSVAYDFFRYGSEVTTGGMKDGYDVSSPTRSFDNFLDAVKSSIAGGESGDDATGQEMPLLRTPKPDESETERVEQVVCPGCRLQIFSKCVDGFIFCEHCGTIHVRDGGVTVLEYGTTAFLKPGEGERLYLPFWVLEVSYHIKDISITSELANIYKLKPAYIKSNGHLRMFIPAFETEPELLKTMTMSLLSRQPEFEHKMPGPDIKHLSCTTSLPDARRMTDFVFVTYIAGKPGVLLNLDFSLNIESEMLHYLPYYKDYEDYEPGF